jgi:hypothetical protein
MKTVGVEPVLLDSSVGGVEAEVMKGSVIGSAGTPTQSACGRWALPIAPAGPPP